MRRETIYEWLDITRNCGLAGICEIYKSGPKAKGSVILIREGARDKSKQTDAQEFSTRSIELRDEKVEWTQCLTPKNIVNAVAWNNVTDIYTGALYVWFPTEHSENLSPTRKKKTQNASTYYTDHFWRLKVLCWHKYKS